MSFGRVRHWRFGDKTAIYGGRRVAVSTLDCDSGGASSNLVGHPSDGTRCRWYARCSDKAEASGSIPEVPTSRLLVTAKWSRNLHIGV